MIRIADDRRDEEGKLIFQKEALEGTLRLDRAEIIRLSLDCSSDFRDGLCGDFTLAWGIEKDGRFVPFNSQDMRFCGQTVIGPANKSHHFESGPFLNCGKIHGDGKPPDARSLIQTLCHWVEEALVEMGKFGEGAEVVCCRPRLLEIEK